MIVSFKSSISLFISCPVVPSFVKSGVLKFPSTTVELLHGFLGPLFPWGQRTIPVLQRGRHIKDAKRGGTACHTVDGAAVSQND